MEYIPLPSPNGGCCDLNLVPITGRASIKQGIASPSGVAKLLRTIFGTTVVGIVLTGGGSHKSSETPSWSGSVSTPSTSTGSSGGGSGSSGSGGGGSSGSSGGVGCGYVLDITCKVGYIHTNDVNVSEITESSHYTEITYKETDERVVTNSWKECFESPAVYQWEAVSFTWYYNNPGQEEMCGSGPGSLITESYSESKNSNGKWDWSFNRTYCCDGEEYPEATGEVCHKSGSSTSPGQQPLDEATIGAVGTTCGKWGNEGCVCVYPIGRIGSSSDPLKIGRLTGTSKTIKWDGSDPQNNITDIRTGNFQRILKSGSAQPTTACDPIPVGNIPGLSWSGSCSDGILRLTITPPDSITPKPDPVTIEMPCLYGIDYSNRWEGDFQAGSGDCGTGGMTQFCEIHATMTCTGNYNDPVIPDED